MNKNNIISKDAIRANIINHIKMYNVNLNELDAKLNELMWGEDETGRYYEFTDEAETATEIYKLSDEECTALSDEDGLMSCEAVDEIKRLVDEVLTEILAEPRVYKLMKRDENRIYDTFPETVDPQTIGFKWETDADGNWHYWCEFEFDEDGEREDSVFSLDDASIWSDDYFVKLTEDMPDEEYQEALDESGREWNEAKEEIENNYYVFSELAEVA